MRNAIKKIISQLPGLRNLYAYRLKRLQLREQQSDARRLEIWNGLFKDQEQKILHKLDASTEIYLFKNSILSRYIYEGVFELDEIAFVKSHLKTGDTFIDVGSNIGLFSLIASNIVGASGKIIGFEPSPVTFSRLKQNIELTKYPNVDIRNIGLSDTNTTLTLNVSGSGHDAWDTFANGGQSAYAETVEVPVATLDNQLDGIDKSSITLVKIDVEGWEKFVLLGAKDLLINYRPTLLIEFTESNTRSAGYEVTEIYDLLVDYGYEWFTFKNGHLLPSKRKQSYPYENLIAKKK